MMLIDEYFSMEKPHEIIKCKYDNTIRYNEQKKIVSQISKTTIVKAPAGFGKTMIGLLSGLQNNKKLIWVTPRNSVAESVYNSVLEESNSLFISPSIQLILGGEIEKSNFDSKKMFDADIIITNIDNFLAPSFKNETMDSSSLIFGCDVIFDEYHELVCDAVLMSLFVNIMRVRHKLTNSKTLLLSATQINCEYLWDSLNNKTTILPNKETHYNAIHDKKYLLKLIRERPIITPNTNSLVVKNTISSAQEEKLQGKYDLLLHNEFLKDKKSDDFKTLLERYGKKSLVSQNKPNVIGTHILQASLDISFNHLFEDVFSPQSTVQRWGRVDRFGNCIGESVITIIKERPNGDINKKYIASQSSIKNLLYTRNLSDAWFDFLLPYNDKKLTLNEVYLIYNDFNKTFLKEIKAFINASHDESKRRLSSVYPVKFDNKIKNSKNILTAGSNKLRSMNNEIFFIVQDKNGKDWVGPFNKQMLKGFDEEFNEDSKTLNRMFKTMEKIRNSNNQLFDYNDIIDDKKYKTIDALRKMSKKSNTPYIVYNRYYDNELGVVKIN
jgi:CRISPR/Cas system-associated endonuclease/helicase Cas3